MVELDADAMRARVEGAHRVARELLWCECESCTYRWGEPRDGVGTIRCPYCRSKNVHITDPEDPDA